MTEPEPIHDDPRNSFDSTVFGVIEYSGTQTDESDLMDVSHITGVLLAVLVLIYRDLESRQIYRYLTHTITVFTRTWKVF